MVRVIKKNLKYVLRLTAIGFGLIAVTLLFVHMKHAKAAANDVIITEIMYNPTGDQLYEYLELYNTTGSTIDLNGWCFTQGISLCFPPGTSLASHSYAVVSPNNNYTLDRYGVNALLPAYTGSLSNSGETVTLKDNTATTVTSVTYSDHAPWPTSPDGTGPSLELKDLTSDLSLSTSWGASLGAPTPAAQNSYLNLVLPSISNVSDPNHSTPAQAITITAQASDATSVDLTYKVNFASDVTVAMADDGASGDGPSGDGVYGATIPGQAAGDLVRFKVAATNADGTVESPGNDDSMDYHGYTVIDSSITSNAPILQWFISDAAYDDMYTNHLTDDVYVTAVIAYGDEVYDNAQVRIKGDYSRTFPKKGYKVKLPKGYKINLAGGSDRAIDEFHLNSGYTSQSIAKVMTAWWAIWQTGTPVPDMSPTRLLRNNQFEGLYLYAEKYEKEWRAEYGYNHGQLFEDYWKLVDGPTDTTARDDWTAHSMLDRKDSTKRQDVLDDNNLPAMISYMSNIALVQHHDNALTRNSLIYRDTSTGRWSAFVWDLDLAFQGGNANTLVSPYEKASRYLATQDDFALTAIYDQLDLRKMYFRRLRTLIDKLYVNDAILQKYDEYVAQYAADDALDLAKWPITGGFNRNEAAYERNMIVVQKRMLVNGFPSAWGLPPSQTSAEKESISIEEAVKSTTNAEEYIKLSNSSEAYVDITGWTLGGIDYTVPIGSVVPAHGSVYIVRDDSGYRAAHHDIVIVGQYENDMNTTSGHTLILRTDTNQEIDRRDY